MDYLDGTPVHELESLRARGVDLSALADRIARIYRRMIFEQGFFHGDPHPGNLLVLRDGRIGLLDFGLAKELPPGFAASKPRRTLILLNGLSERLAPGERRISR